MTVLLMLFYYFFVALVVLIVGVLHVILHNMWTTFPVIKYQAPNGGMLRFDMKYNASTGTE